MMRRRPSPGLFAVAVWCLVLGMGFGGRLVAEGLPAKPVTHVLDEAGLFDRHPKRLELISGRLLELQENHDLPVYLVLYGGLLDANLADQARELHRAWIGDRLDGIVVVWDGDMRQLEFGLPMTAHLDLEEQNGPMTRMPDHRLDPVLKEVRSSVEGLDDKRELVERLSVVLVARLDWMLRDLQPRRGITAGEVAVATLALGGILGLLGLVAAKFLRQSEIETRRQCYFPDVVVGGRLGASFGGGRVAVVDYMKSEPEEEE